MLQSIIQIKLQHWYPTQMVLYPIGQSLLNFPCFIVDYFHGCRCICHLKKAEVYPCFQQVWCYLNGRNGNHSTTNHTKAKPPHYIVEFILQYRCYLFLTFSFLHICYFCWTKISYYLLPLAIYVIAHEEIPGIIKIP